MSAVDVGRERHGTPAAVHRTLSIPAIDTRTATALRLFATRPFPFGLASEIVRAANDVIEQLRCAGPDPVISIDTADGHFELKPVDVECEPSMLGALASSIEIRRGRRGARVVRTGDTDVLRNGWPLPRALPVRLAHGDVVSTTDGHLVAQLMPRPPRPAVALGGIRSDVAGPELDATFTFAVAPAGVPVSVSIDPATCRAIVDLVLDGDGSRAFDASLLGEIERAVLEWTLHQIAIAVSIQVFGGSVAFTPSEPEPLDATFGFSASLRVGAYCGAVRIVTTDQGLDAMATALAPYARASIRRHPLLRRIATTIAACLILGRISTAELAAVDVGDVFAASGLRLDAAGASRATGVVESTAAGVAVLAELSWTPRGLDARITGAVIAHGEDSMDIERTAAEPVVVDPFASVIDTIQVTVSVELARRRIALTELLNTQEGSVLEFGAPVSTDVTLMIDGSPFARGEIVSIDDRVGVRVVSLGGRR